MRLQNVFGFAVIVSLTKGDDDPFDFAFFEFIGAIAVDSRGFVNSLHCGRVTTLTPD